jgi:hypothetical protein
VPASPARSGHRVPHRRELARAVQSPALARRRDRGE